MTEDQRIELEAEYCIPENSDHTFGDDNKCIYCGLGRD